MAKKQKEAIDAQQVVIGKQDELISAQQEQVDNERNQKNLFLGAAAGEALYIILKALIGF